MVSISITSILVKPIIAWQQNGNRIAAAIRGVIQGRKEGEKEVRRSADRGCQDHILSLSVAHSQDHQLLSPAPCRSPSGTDVSTDTDEAE